MKKLAKGKLFAVNAFLLQLCICKEREGKRKKEREMFHNLDIRFTSVKMINSDEVTAEIVKYMYQ